MIPATRDSRCAGGFARIADRVSSPKPMCCRALQLSSLAHSMIRPPTSRGWRFTAAAPSLGCMPATNAHVFQRCRPADAQILEPVLRVRFPPIASAFESSPDRLDDKEVRLGIGHRGASIQKTAPYTARSSFRGGAQRRARNPFSRGRCSWFPGCLAALGPRNDEILQCKADVEVTPVGIVFLNQSDLPIAPPLLDLFFACDCRHRVIIALEPDEPIDAVSGGEASQQLVLMLVHPTDQIIGDAQIQRPVSPARKQINVVAQHCFPVCW